MTDLERIEELHQRGLYNILFRNAGVGLLFYEPPAGFEIEYMMGSGIGYHIKDEWRKYLVVRHYYPTLEEAVSAELERLEVAT